MAGDVERAPGWCFDKPEDSIKIMQRPDQMQGRGV